MEKIPDLFKIKKKTIHKVIIFHIIFILVLAFQFKSSKIHKKKNLVVNNVIVPKNPQKTIIQKKPTPKPLLKPIARKSYSPTIKKDIQKIEKKASLISALEKQIKTLEKKEEKSSSKNDLLIPKNVKKIDIDKLLDIVQKNDSNNYKELLVKELQNNLNLPEYGAVKVSLKIHPTGEISDIVILDSQSEKNQRYLKNSLIEISFKSINKMFDDTQEFTVTFKNE